MASGTQGEVGIESTELRSSCCPAQEYVKELERREKEEREREKEERKRQERKARDTFKDLLRKHKWV